MTRGGFILCFMYMFTIMIECGAYKILVVFPVPAGSHSNLGEGYVRHLLNAGHEVTYITPFPKKEGKPNLREISVAENSISADALNINSLMKKKLELNQQLVFELMFNITKTTMMNKNVQKLLNDPSERFDIVVAEWMFNEVYCGFAAVFNCPYIWAFSYEPNFVSLGLIDEGSHPAYTANIEFNDIPPFTFRQRVNSLWFQIKRTLTNNIYHYGLTKEVYENTFTPVLKKRGRNLPHFDELRYNASMILGNSHVSMGQAIRLPQNYIPIAGYHIDNDVKPLPDNLQKIMDNAKDGVIYFSMGSNLKSKDLADDIKRNLFKMFGELKQTVVWKFEEGVTDRPENVHLLQWAPQQSILAHPKCILFITHGGLLSTTEAVHFGVPAIGIPVFFDQNFNVERAEQIGIFKKVLLSENLVTDLKDAIQEVFSNSKYQERMKEVSFIYHHRPVPPGAELVHWVEHVVRTGGAPHLRSPALFVPWYQKMYLDLAALILVLLYTLVYITKLLCFSKQKLHNKKKTT